ncbi:MAG: hypothetical protein M5R40_21960 [Anaerolineae bacterium]|nr:hypothetical protein [Anaerolineae bacterium]
MPAHTPAPPDHAPPSSPVDGGLVGIASTLPVSGRPTIEALSRLRWRGNGRSGGVAVAGCFPVGLADVCALNIALSARHLRAEIEREFIAPHFDIVEAEFQPDLGDFRALAGLPSRPPVVVRYFVRARQDALAEFAAQQGLAALDRAEDEFVYWSATRINRALYTGHPERRAFVLSYGRDLMILRAAGYAEDVARYYRLDEMPAHVWLGHQSYATRTEPAGANPFPAVDVAAALSGGLVNYDALATYVRQRGYLPLFRSDAELTAALFDFYRRACAYPLDLALEALYPTPRDGLGGAPQARREAYRAVQRTHVHGALAGRVAFAVARACREARGWELIAAIDPERQHAHAFGLQEGTLWGGERYGVGVVASELQAVEAVFAAIAEEQSAVCPIPDKTWSAGSLDGDFAGSAAGGAIGGAAYSFTVAPQEDGGLRLWCADRYGRAITTDRARMHRDPRYASAAPSELDPSPAEVAATLRTDDVDSAYARARAAVREWGFILLGSWLDGVVTLAASDPALRWPAIQLLTWLHDRPIDIGVKKRSAALAMLRRGLEVLFQRARSRRRRVRPRRPGPPPDVGDARHARRADAHKRAALHRRRQPAARRRRQRGAGAHPGVPRGLAQHRHLRLQRRPLCRQRAGARRQRPARGHLRDAG